jgi:hypothetical protein
MAVAISPIFVATRSTEGIDHIGTDGLRFDFSAEFFAHARIALPSEGQKDGALSALFDVPLA